MHGYHLFPVSILPARVEKTRKKPSSARISFVAIFFTLRNNSPQRYHQKHKNGEPGLSKIKHDKVLKNGR